MTALKELINVRGVTKYFEGSDLPTLKNIDLTINEGEFTAILGPSGSGKSTLIRLITGLIDCTEGEIIFEGKKVNKVNPYAAIVFQSFALFPWLTVLENVELGLKAAGFPKNFTNRKAEELIDLIGLDGFEDAYPKELSGGMRQRVGFARALAVEPKLLCMDEPFSALDYLTAENLRTELMDLWIDKKMPIKSIIMVTHGIEEAVLMADRIIILSKSPANIIADVKINMPYPRNRKSDDFEKAVDNIYKIMTDGETAKNEEARKQKVNIEIKKTEENIKEEKFKYIPHAYIGVMAGLIELIYDNNGKMDIYQLGRDLMLEADDILPNLEGLEMLGFADVHEGDIFITELGSKYVEADIDESKRIFAEQIKNISTFRVIINVLNSKKNKTMREEFFKELFMQQFPYYMVDSMMEIIVDWGRYAELFYYEYDSEEFYLETEVTDEI